MLRVAFDLPEGSAAAALHDGADPQCDWLMPGLLREPVLYPDQAVRADKPAFFLPFHSSVTTEDITYSVDYVKQCM